MTDWIYFLILQYFNVNRFFIVSLIKDFLLIHVLEISWHFVKIYIQRRPNYKTCHKIDLHGIYNRSGGNAEYF